MWEQNIQYQNVKSKRPIIKRQITKRQITKRQITKRQITKRPNVQNSGKRSVPTPFCELFLNYYIFGWTYCIIVTETFQFFIFSDIIEPKWEKY